MSSGRLATIGLPVGDPGDIGIAAGTYTDIVEIVAPSTAPAGSEVSVTIRIKNIWTDSVHVAAIGIKDTEERFIDWLDYWIPAGQTHSFSGSFIMPAREVTIHAYSFYEAADELWYFDDEAERDVSVEAVWQKLATRIITITPEVVAWQKLASRTIEITPTPEEIPLEYVLIQHTIYHFAYIYDGDVEVTTATFKTDPFTPSAWAAQKFADTLEREVRKKGGRVLEVKVDVDTTPLLWTNFRIEVTSTPLGEAIEATPGIGVAGIPIAVTVLIIALAIIAVIVVATLMWERFQRTFTHYPELKQVKPAWGKEALILDIQDAEEYWEHPLTPVETLEEMSEEELRDHLDKIAEAEFPPEEEFPWPLVLIGGLGVLGVGAAVALATVKQE